MSYSVEVVAPDGEIWMFEKVTDSHYTLVLRSEINYSRLPYLNVLDSLQAVDLLESEVKMRNSEGILEYVSKRD